MQKEYTVQDLLRLLLKEKGVKITKRDIVCVVKYPKSGASGFNDTYIFSILDSIPVEREDSIIIDLKQGQHWTFYFPESENKAEILEGNLCHWGCHVRLRWLLAREGRQDLLDQLKLRWENG